MNNDNSIKDLKYLLKEMFQFNENDLDFGIYKIYNLKRKNIEGFIDGDGENDLTPTIEKILKEVNLENQKSDSIDLFNFLKGINKESLLNDPDSNYSKIQMAFNFEDDEDKKQDLQDTLDKISKSSGLTEELKDKIYNHILGFFQMYYSNGDFGYNDRSRDVYKVPYEADYNGTDTMFHWKHKGSLYIKTGTSFNAIKFQLNGKKIEYRLETNTDSENESVARNNNKDTQLKHYQFNRIEKIDDAYHVIFNLAETSTSKVDIFKAVYSEVINNDDVNKYLEYVKDGKKHTVFNDLGKDFDKVQNGQIKGLSALRQSKEKVAKEAKNNFDRGVKLYDDIKKEFADDTLRILYILDQKLNSFYIGNDADYFIHENLQGFLTNEKQRFVKNYIFDDLESIYNGKLDNTTLLIAKAFDKVTSRIIEFLSSIEDFQKHLFTKKKKVIESEYCITLDYINEAYFKEILDNKIQLEEWQNLFSLDIKSLEDLKANPTLVIDTKCFKQPNGTNPFKDKVLAEIDDLDNKTTGLLINSENYQALALLQTKFKEKIKTIYIDPPYNTGGDSFAYKDNFKHSSWLSFMQNRIELSKNFFTKDGVLFCSIDDNEFDSLYGFLNSSFGKQNEIANFIWSGGRKNDSKLVSMSHEYMLAFTFDKEHYEKNKLTWRIKKKGLDKIYNKYESLKKTFKDDYSKIEIELKDWFKGLPNSDPTKLQKHYSSVDKRGIYFPDNISWPGGGGPKYEVLHPLTKKPVAIPSRGWMFAEPEKLQKLIDDNRVHFGKDETNVPCIKSYLKDRETQVPYSVFYQDGRASTKRLRNIYGKDLFKNPKDEQVLAEILEFSTDTNDYILDFFAGTGTTYHSILMNNKEYDRNNKCVLVEMGSYFSALTKPRIQKVIYSDNWTKGKPKDNDGSIKHILKYQVLEQYEDVLDNLQIYDGILPEDLPLKYLYKPEINGLDNNLDIFKPFCNKIKYGQPSQEGFIDLLETYNYIQGYFIQSIKTYTVNTKYYKVVETTNGVLVIWREITLNEDDSKSIREIISKYSNIHTIEVNAHFATLQLDKNNNLKVGDYEVELHIIQKEIFNQ